MKEEKRKAVWKNVRDFVDYIVTPIAIALLVIFFVFAASKALGMGVFERYGIAATRDDITEAVDPIARQAASNETSIASHATQLESLGNLAYLDTLAASDVGAYSTNKVDELLDDKLDKSGGIADNLLICGTNEAIKFDDYFLYMYRKINGTWVANNVWDLRTSQDGTVAFLSDIYDAVQQIAPAFTAKTYVAKDLCTYNGALYRCKAGYTATASSAPPVTDTTHWEAKKVSDLFLPLTGGTMTGDMEGTNISVVDASGGFLKLAGEAAGTYFYYRNGWHGADSPIYQIVLPDANGTLALAAGNGHDGHLAALDASGNPTDSGIPKSDAITTSSAAWIDITNRLHQLEMQM